MDKPSNEEIDLGIGSSPMQVSAAARNEITGVKNSDVMIVDPEITNTQLQICLNDFGFTAMTADEFMAAGTDAFNKSLVQACKAGAAFWAAQEALKNTTTSDVVANFKDWIVDAGLSEPRVYECIKLAKLYGRLPANQREQMLKVGKKQALLLAGLPQEVIEESAESGQDVFAEAEVLSYAELKAKVKQYALREKNYDADLERLRLKVDRLEKAREPLTPFLARTEEIRSECAFYQEESEITVNSLRKLFDDVNLEPRAPEFKFQVEQIWLTTNFIAAMAVSAAQQMRELCAVELPESLGVVHMMTPAEAARWLEDAAAIRSQYEGRKAARELLRGDAKKTEKTKKRGRPANGGND